MKRLLTTLNCGLLVLVPLVALPTKAQTAPATAAVAAPAAAPLTDAEVRKIDTQTKKITLKHGEIKNLDMPPMTMVFQVADPALLEGVKPGDKVRFSAQKVDGAYTVTAMELQK